jgi:hypothetical protein
MPDDRDNLPIDPPDNQGGGNVAIPSEGDATLEPEAAPIDPPDNQGGGG